MTVKSLTSQFKISKAEQLYRLKVQHYTLSPKEHSLKFDRTKPLCKDRENLEENDMNCMSICVKL